MDHMIVEGQHHQRWIGDNPAENAGIHGVKINRLGMDDLTEARDGLIRREDPSFLCARHTRNWRLDQKKPMMESNHN
jgi:hypothetical protein